MEKDLILNMFGGYILKYGDQTITLGRCTTAKSVQLLQILLLYRETGIEKEKLAQLLYDWKNVTDANNSLNSLIYRLKNQLIAAGLPKEEYIVTRGGICRWCSEIPVWVDTVEFEKSANAAETAVGMEKRRLLEMAVKLYKGELLPRMAGELWVIVEGVRLKKMYVSCVQKLGGLLAEEQEYEHMYKLYRSAAEIYPFDEWQEKEIDALRKLKRFEEAFQVYKEAVSLYREEFGTLPPKSMNELYRKMGGKPETEEYDSGDIQTALCESGWKNGAYYCGYPAFTDMYRLMCRVIERSGQLICLMMCTLYYEDSEYEIDSKVENCLKLAIEKSLRRGDICTRYSWNQYLMLVSVRSRENCELIFERIRLLFDAFNEKKECRVRCDIAEVINPVKNR